MTAVQNSVPTKIVMRGTSKMSLSDRFGSVPVIDIGDIEEKKPIPVIISSIQPKARVSNDFSSALVSTTRAAPPRSRMIADEIESTMLRGSQNELVYETRNNRDLIRRFEANIAHRSQYGDHDDRDAQFDPYDDVVEMDPYYAYQNRRRQMFYDDQLVPSWRAGYGGGSIHKRYADRETGYIVRTSYGLYTNRFGTRDQYDSMDGDWRMAKPDPIHDTLDMHTQYNRYRSRSNGYRGHFSRGGGYRRGGFRGRGRGGYRGGYRGRGGRRLGLRGSFNFATTHDETKRDYWRMAKELDQELDEYVAQTERKKKEAAQDDSMV